MLADSSICILLVVGGANKVNNFTKFFFIPLKSLWLALIQTKQSFNNFVFETFTFCLLRKLFFVSEKKISCINIAPGPIKTRRLEQLAKNLDKFEKKLPMKYAAGPDEIGNFVKSILKNKIKYLNGVTINFDGGLSDFLF